MKKSAIIIMTLAILLSVTACNKEQSDTYDTTDTIAVHEDVTAQSNADNVATENAEQMTDSNGNSVSSTDKQSGDNNTTESGQPKTNKADATTTKKTDSSQKDEKTTQTSNPFGSGIELPEMEV